jgi:hypothetical protein
MAGLGLILAGAAAGMGGQMVENARMKREEALRAQEREWQLQDRQSDRDWQTQNRQQDRDWQTEDRDFEYGRQDASSARAAGALGDIYGTDLIGLIDATEGGGDYDTLFGHSQREGSPFAGVRVTEMTLGELYEFSDPSGEYGSWVRSTNPEGVVATPMGRFQIVGTTLRNAAEEMGLPPDTVFTPEVQDQIARHLADQRLASADTIAGKREALRNEWAGFRGVSDEALDAAIRQYEGGESAFAAMTDPNVTADAREAIRTGLGIGLQPDEGVTNPFWRDNGDGTKTRMGTNSQGRVVEVMGVDGKPVIETNTPSSSDRADGEPADLKSTTMTRIENLPGVMIAGGSGRDPQPDPNLVAVVAEEVLRLMTDEGLSETQAYAKAVRGMQFDTVETRPAESGTFGIGGRPAQTGQRFTGEFNYDGETEEDRRAASTADSPLPADPAAPTGLGGAAGTEPTRQAQPLPTNRDDLVRGQVYTIVKDGQTITVRFDGTNFVAME